jgi:hypothetical protein
MAAERTIDPFAHARELVRSTDERRRGHLSNLSRRRAAAPPRRRAAAPHAYAF